MPPLPPRSSPIPALTQRLTTLSDSNKIVSQLIQRLSKLDFQPGSLPLDSDADPRIELTAEIHESLKGIEEELELLKQEVEDVVEDSGAGIHRRRDSERDRDKARLAVLLARLGEDLKVSHAQFRKAQLTAKRSADRAKQQERALIFNNLHSGSSTPSSLNPATLRKPTQSTQSLTADEVIASASSDVTAALRRTHQLMQSELSRSRFAQETLENSTKALSELGEKYTDLTSLLANSKNLVSTLLTSQKSDTWYLETAFYILVTTIIWLIFRRWLYGPLTWFVWWPIKLFYKFVVLTFVGVFGITGNSKNVAASEAQSTRTSLIVKPSATGGIPKRPVVDDNEPAPYIRVGGGGRGYNYNPSPPGSMSERVGEMAEQAQNQQTKEEAVVRGDGTVLQESDKPRNPKKRMWDEDVERVKFERKVEEEREKVGEDGKIEGDSGGKHEADHGGKVKRDEL